MKKIVCMLLAILIVFNGSIQVYASEMGSVFAKSSILYDAESGRVLYENNSDERVAIASTTKIMTCIITLEKTNDLSKELEVSFSKKAASMPDVQLNAREGETFLVKDLVYSLMLESHNDTAVAIAEAIGGDVEGFAKMMNEKAKELKMNNTNFVTPNGLDDENHYSTAYDMALLTRYAMRNSMFKKIICTRQHSFNSYKKNDNNEKVVDKQYSVSNKDRFLDMMEGACGVKTGYTSEAGYCFVGALERNNKRLISVVLGSGWPPEKNKKWIDTKKIMSYGVENYYYKILWDSNEFDYKINVKKGEKKTCKLRAKGIGQYLVCKEDTYDVKINIPNTIKAPVCENQKIGTAEIYINGKKIEQFDITSDEDIKKKKIDVLKDKIGHIFACIF